MQHAPVRRARDNPGMSRGHGPLADAWSLSVMVYNWLYNVVNPPDLPRRGGEKEEVCWFALLGLWVDMLLMRLEDKSDDPFGSRIA